jgi:Molecular chaperone (small heat shock protein)
MSKDFPAVWDDLESTLNDIRRAISRRAFGYRTEVREPYLDMIDRENEIEIIAELPGVDKKGIEVSIYENSIEISAESKSESEERKENYYCRERECAKFRRKLTLPSEIEPENAKSKYENGILRIILPKKEKKKGRKIPVE